MVRGRREILGRQPKAAFDLHKCDFAEAQWQGERQAQEDAVRCAAPASSNGLLVTLADGMGGHEGGKYAAQLALDAAHEAFLSQLPTLDARSRLIAAALHANNEIGFSARNNPQLRDMGCTLVGLFVSGEGLIWISIGDSLLILVRKGKAQRLNQDHSMSPLMDAAVRMGSVDQQFASNAANRSMLRSALVGEPLELVDVPEQHIPLRERDVLICASDGLLTLSLPEIERVVKERRDDGAQALSHALIDAVKRKNRRKQDNTSVVTVIMDQTLGGSTPRSSLLPLLSMLASFVAGAILSGALFWNGTTLPNDWGLLGNLSSDKKKESEPAFQRETRPENSAEESLRNPEKPSGHSLPNLVPPNQRMDRSQPQSVMPKAPLVREGQKPEPLSR
jgi:serine/threonine protein phosphatase PrpC